jgi:hypothetical protein
MPGTFNPYLYGMNNPVMYTDPSGNCAEPVTLVLCLTAIGVGVGIIANWGSQVYHNVQGGMSFWDAVYYKNLNGKQLTIAGVRAGVGTLTFAIIGPSTFLGFLATGCVAELASGRVGALTDASWEQVASLYQGNGMSVRKFVEDAQAVGFLDGSTLVFDALNGSVTGALTFGLGKVIPEFGPSKSPGGPPIIRLLPGGGIRVEVSGRPGLYVAPSQKAALGYALLNGAREIVSDLVTSFLGELFPEWKKDAGQTPVEGRGAKLEFDRTNP